MRFFFITFLFTFLFPTFSNSTPQGLTGRQVYNAIVIELGQKGLDANPAIQFNRVYAPCSSKLSIDQFHGSWKTVRVTCQSNKNWKLVVRTNLGEKVEFVRLQKSPTARSEKSQMVALRKSIGRNEVLQEADLVVVFKTEKIGGGYFANLSDLVGRTSKVSLSAGTILKARHLEKNYLVHKDQLVTIEHNIANIMINTEGIAQAFGQKGERIWVKNVNSGKKILCWVKSEKKVSTTAKIY
ncbi:MAG: flagellar basal body P-ring formation chaperone FlgA [Pseudomonadota bacterium]|nr:flagellar basal body P-ring formation chaperone FlgA [Pseudomonadota bacterium]